MKNSSVKKVSKTNIDKDRLWTIASFAIVITIVASVVITSVTGELTKETEKRTGTDKTPPTAYVTHSPSSPKMHQKVIHTATGIDNVGISSVDIYVDNVNVKTCTSSPCRYENSYSSGLHTYYATATDTSSNSKKSAVKNFIVAVDKTPATTSVTLSPPTPTANQKVTYTATTTVGVRISSIQLYVDNVNVKTCNSSPCTYETSHSSFGWHEYYAIVTYVPKSVIKTTVKYFKLKEICGDGFVQLQNKEECDDGSARNNDTGPCTTQCKLTGTFHTLRGGQNITTTFSGRNYTVTVISTFSPTLAVIKVDNDQKSITKGSSAVIGGLNVSVDDIYLISLNDQTQNTVKLFISRG